MLSRIIFSLVNFVARKGLAPDANGDPSPQHAKQRALRTGVRGETYAYWYLRRHGYVFVARNFTAPGIKGEIDLIGYDRGVLAFVEVKTRIADPDCAPLAKPEDAITHDKRRNLSRAARQFLTEKGLHQAQCRFDVLAIECESGKRPQVRLHKNAW
ncbi:MAG: YraN family protein [Candidatus Acidiferrales bacterium]